MKARTVYLLRIREDDESAWGEPASYRTRAERDKVAAQCRAWCGLRTWSYEEKPDAVVIEASSVEDNVNA